MKSDDDAVMVRVVWKDAHANAERWYDMEDLKGPPLLVTTVGIRLQGKEDHVTIVQSITSDLSIDHPIFIPEAMVVSIQELGVVEEPKRSKAR